MPLLAILLLAAPPEDAAHRADRLRTEALNRGAADDVTARDHANAGARDQYRAARAAYQREMAAWHARVAACEGGDYAACR